MNTISREKYGRHYQVTEQRNVRSLNPMTKCAITGKRLFLKKCLHLKVQIPSYAKYAGGPLTDVYNYYVDEGEYMLERLALPPKEEGHWII